MKRRLTIRTLSILVAGLGAAGAAHAQAPIQVDELWRHRVNDPIGQGATRDSSHVFFVDADGNSYVTGQVQVDIDRTEIALWRYKPDGALCWTVTWEGSDKGLAHGTALAVHGDSIYVAGTAPAPGVGLEYVVLRYDLDPVDPNANPPGLVWSQQHAPWGTTGVGAGDDVPVAIGLAFPDLPDLASVVVTGTSMGVGTGDDYATSKYRMSDGLFQGVQRYDGPDHKNDRAVDMLVVIATGSSAGMYTIAAVVTGTSYSNTTQDDYLTVRHDFGTVGSPWTARFGGLYKDTAVDMTEYGGDPIITGSHFIPGGAGAESSYDFATVKYNVETGMPFAEWPGVALYTRNDGIDGDDFVRKATVVKDENGEPWLYLTGASWGGSTVGYQFTTARFSPLDGTQNFGWEVQYDRNTAINAEDRGMDIVGVYNSLGIFVTGNVFNGVSADYETQRRSTRIPASEIWRIGYNSPINGEDVPVAIRTKDGEFELDLPVLYVSGRSRAMADFDQMTIKYRQFR